MSLAKNKKLLKKYGKIFSEFAMVFEAQLTINADLIAPRAEDHCKFTADFTIFL